MALFKISRIVRDSEGDVVPSVQVTVNQGGTSTKQTIYSDAAGTAKANPLTSGSDGRYDFWVDEGAEIDLDFTKTGYTIPSEDGITVPWISDSVAPTRTVATTSPLTGGGDLSANRTLGFDAFVDVRAHGATGDGTTDDTTAINAALTAGAGKMVFFPPGNYRVTSNLTPGAGSWILGAGMGATTITMDSTGTSRRVLHVTVDRVHVSDLKIDGGSQTTPIAHQGVSLIDSDYCVVERVWTVNTGQYGIVVGDGGGDSGKGLGHVIRNNFVDMTGTAIASAAPAGIEIFPRGGVGFLADPPVLVEGNTILAGTVALNGIKCSQNRGARIVGNYVSGATSASATGAINVLQAENYVIANNVINDTRIGISISGVVGVGNGVRLKRVAVVGNVVRKFSVAGVYSNDGQSDALVQGNVLDVDGGGAADGVRLNCANGGADYTDLAILNNTILGGGVILRTDGATSALGFPRARISGNLIKAPAGGFSIGVYYDGTNSKDVVIANNVIESAPSTSIDARGERPRISGNKIFDGNTGDTADIGAIQLVGGDGGYITENYAENISGGAGHMKWGVTLNGTDDIVFRDNRFVGMETGEIRTILTVTSALPRTQGMSVNNTTATNPSDTAENTLRSYNVVRGSTTKFGGLKILAAGTVSGTTDAKTIRLKLDTATVCTIAFAAGATGEWLIEAEMWAADSEGAQRWSIRGYESTALESTQPDYVTSSVNLSTADRTLALTAQTANSADEITQTMWRVEKIQ